MKVVIPWLLRTVVPPAGYSRAASHMLLLACRATMVSSAGRLVAMIITWDRLRRWPTSGTTVSIGCSAGAPQANRHGSPERSAEKGRVADLSPVMVNQVLEATLAVMILLLAMSVTAIVRGPGPTLART